MIMMRITLIVVIVGSALMGCEAQIRTVPAGPVVPPQATLQPAPGWVMLAEMYSAESGRQFINVLGQGGEFRRLRIEGVRGKPVITRVAIEFMDRSMQVVDLNAQLWRGEEEEIRLYGRGQRINRIIVYTDPMHGGMYSVYGT
jgi:hypothetical protein